MALATAARAGGKQKLIVSLPSVKVQQAVKVCSVQSEALAQTRNWVTPEHSVIFWLNWVGHALGVSHDDVTPVTLHEGAVPPSSVTSVQHTSAEGQSLGTTHAAVAELEPPWELDDDAWLDADPELDEWCAPVSTAEASCWPAGVVELELQPPSTTREARAERSWKAVRMGRLLARRARG